MRVEPAVVTSQVAAKTTSPSSTTPLKTTTAVTYSDFSGMQPSSSVMLSTVAGSCFTSAAISLYCLFHCHEFFFIEITLYYFTYVEKVKHLNFLSVGSTTTKRRTTERTAADITSTAGSAYEYLFVHSVWIWRYMRLWFFSVTWNPCLIDTKYWVIITSAASETTVVDHTVVNRWTILMQILVRGSWRSTMCCQLQAILTYADFSDCSILQNVTNLDSILYLVKTNDCRPNCYWGTDFWTNRSDITLLVIQPLEAFFVLIYR